MFTSQNVLGDRNNMITLLDMSNMVFRAYHAVPALSTSSGIPTNAVFGFTKVLLKHLRDRPTSHVAMAADLNSREARRAIDPSYKATRPTGAEDLSVQFDYIYRLLGCLNIQTVAFNGYEADDVIATLSRQALKAGLEVEIVSSDKDLIQLLQPGIRVYDAAKAKYHDDEYVKERYGIRPDQMRDYLSLVGDKIDNVAKVPGIGPKTAQKLLSQFGNLDTLIQNLDKIEKDSVREVLAKNLGVLDTAKKLVSLHDDLNIVVDFNDLKLKAANTAELETLFKELEFTNIDRFT